MIGKMKKAILIIVEGKSDKAALEVVLRELYITQTNIKFYVKNGDITSDKTTTEKNIIKRIQNIINEVIRDTKLKTIDFDKVILITDTDGCFVEDCLIKSNKSTVELIYSETQIECKDVDEIIKRNQLKSGILKYIVSEIPNNKICGIDFRCFYMLCNLEHVLYNEINVQDDMKIEKGYVFSKEYANKVFDFISLINEAAKEISDDYNESWNFIMNNNESLKRHTNFYIFFKNNPCGQYLYNI